MDSRSTQMGIVLAIVAVVLILVSQATNVSGWVIVVIFVVVSLVARFAWPSGGGSDT